MRIRYDPRFKNHPENKMNCAPAKHLKLFACITIFLFTLGSSGCVDLSGVKYYVSKKRVHPQPVVKKTAHDQYFGEVYTMLGGLGVFSTGMQELSDSIVAAYNIPAPSGMWYNAGNVRRQIADYYFTHKTRRPVILVGHSLGANEQIKVARMLNKEGIPVDLLITVDAVSQTIVPQNVKHALNFYKSGYVPMFSGLRLRAVDPGKTRIDNIDVTALKGVKVNHFTIDKDPVVQAIMMAEVKKVLSNAHRAKS